MTLKHQYSLLIILAITVFSLAPIQSQAQENTDKTYVQIHVNGLSCPFCAYGLEKKLKKVEGAANLYIELEAGIVSFEVPKNKKPSEDELKKIVTDAGFTPREIKFSDTPFKKKEDEN